jgi:hypothetical protein
MPGVRRFNPNLVAVPNLSRRSSCSAQGYCLVIDPVRPRCDLVLARPSKAGIERTKHSLLLTGRCAAVLNRGLRLQSR